MRSRFRRRAPTIIIDIEDMESTNDVGADADLFLRLLQETAETTGHEFFRSLVRNLASALGTHGAWVTDYLPESRRLRARAFWLGGRFVDHYEYGIANTPCEPVAAEGRFVHVPERVVELYPQDADLVEMNAVSYTGAPILDGAGSVIGHLAVLDTKPLPETPRHVGVFSIFAARAAAEMRRLQAETALREREERLSRLIGGAMDGIVDLDADLTVRLINESAAASFGVEPAAGLSLRELVDEATLASLGETIAGMGAAGGDESSRSLWLAGGLRGRRPDGTTFEIEGTLSSAEAAGRPFFTLIFRDVEARLAAERRIRQLEAEASYLQEELDVVRGGDRILGESAAIRAALEAARQVADTDAAVLLTGESGTGKELFARAIHAHSARRARPLVAVNCAAIPSELVESEFFGHEKGAFTGATARREGRFAVADGGTIFLDEIGDLPLAMQAKLLRVLQEGTFEPVGSSRTCEVDVRVIAATHRDLVRTVAAGTFREDLYYRLAVFPIAIPPLRARGDDVLRLADAFLAAACRRLGRRVQPLGDADRRRLLAYDWPGNVRELQNVIERAVITARDGRVDVARVLGPGGQVPNAAGQSPVVGADDERVLTDAELRDFERENLRRALERCDWRVAGEGGAARLLGLSASTLSSRMKALGLRRPSR